ncbi:DsrE family protein [Sulfurimonas sp.]
MKKALIILILFTSVLSAELYKAVFDCSSSNPRYIVSRMLLIEKTKNMMQKDGDEVDFALTLHGGCVTMVSKNYDFIVKDEDIKYIKKAQQTIKKLSKEGVKITVCAMSLAANSIDKEDVVPFVHISKNSYIDTIKYQNHGYALMPLK